MPARSPLHGKAARTSLISSAHNFSALSMIFGTTLSTAFATDAFTNFPTQPKSAGTSAAEKSMVSAKAGAFIASVELSNRLPMRILTLTNLYPPHYLGGYELICYMVTNELRARGHHVNVLTSDHSVPERTVFPETSIERTLRIHGFYGHPWLNIARLQRLEAYN